VPDLGAQGAEVHEGLVERLHIGAGEEAGLGDEVRRIGEGRAGVAGLDGADDPEEEGLVGGTEGRGLKGSLKYGI
jgi:hypothetical protein